MTDTKKIRKIYEKKDWGIFCIYFIRAIKKIGFVCLADDKTGDYVYQNKYFVIFISKFYKEIKIVRKKEIYFEVGSFYEKITPLNFLTEDCNEFKTIFESLEGNYD